MEANEDLHRLHGDVRSFEQLTPFARTAHTRQTPTYKSCCGRSKSGSKTYDRQLHMQNVGSDMFDIDEVIEPINSSTGISYAQQLHPTTRVETPYGPIYTEHDSVLTRNKYMQGPETVNEANVYDPRFTGYGSSNRSYEDKQLGQTRYFYDDVNAVRMPNYISRSNLDFASYADSYGPLRDFNRYGNVNTADIRQFAQNSFLQAGIDQRESVSQSLLRKRNSEMWQVRYAPKR